MEKFTSINGGFRLTITALVAISVLAGCPFVRLGSTLRKGEVIYELTARRRSMSVVEADFKIRFPEGFLFAAGVEGHAAYELSGDGPKLRLVAFGPMGVQVIDLLVKDGDFMVKAPGIEGPVGQEELRAIYGEGTITRAPALLAKRPGLFFGGIPEGIDSTWSWRHSRQGAWLGSPDGFSLLVSGKPPIIRRAVMFDKEAGEMSIDFGGWQNDSKGPFPTKATIKIDKKTLFHFKLIDLKTGTVLPPGVFVMKTACYYPPYKLLKIKTF